MTKPDPRYLINAGHYLKQVEMVWGRYFQSREAFSSFYQEMQPDSEKSLFLRVGSFYRFLVVEGRYRFRNRTWNKGMPYIDDTYKYIAVFSLIEALETPPDYADFFQWLRANKQHGLEGVDCNRHLIDVLEPLYRKYKEEHGSVQAAVRFFSRLGNSDQQRIQDKLKISQKTLSIKKLAQLLYNLRSEFLHQARFVLGFGHSLTVSKHREDIIANDLSMEDICSLFEHGFLARFSYEYSTQKRYLLSDTDRRSSTR